MTDCTNEELATIDGGLDPNTSPVVAFAAGFGCGLLMMATGSIPVLGWYVASECLSEI